MTKSVVVIPFGMLLPELNYQLTIAEISKLTDVKIPWGEKLPELMSDFEEYNRGKLPFELFKSYIETALDLEFFNGTFEKSWNAMLGKIPGDLGEKLKSLKQLEKDHDCKVILISNTNQLHSEKILAELKKQNVTTEEIPPLKTTWQHGLNKLELVKKVFEDEQSSDYKLLILGSEEHVRNPQLKAKNEKDQKQITDFGSTNNIDMIEVDPKNHFDLCTIIQNQLANGPSCKK